MLMDNALKIQSESAFEENWLENIIKVLEKGENKGFSLLAETDKLTHLEYMIISFSESNGITPDKQLNL